MEQEECTGVRPHAGYSVTSNMARLQPTQCIKRPVQCIRGHIWKSGGSMVKIQFTNLVDLLWVIQQFQDNYNRITSNGHSKLSEDLATFMFCSSLPKSYKPTTWQYLKNITVIANYKLMDIIARVLQEESRRKAQALGQGSSLNKFSTVNNIRQKCAKCGKLNHSTQNHWSRGKHPQMGKGQKSQKVSGLTRKKKADKKGKRKGTNKCQCIRHCGHQRIVSN